jgi:hypothetical protein
MSGIIFNGLANFSSPVEVQGSPQISTDEVTQAKMVNRSYAVVTANYKPLAQGQQDYQFSDCWLVNETPETVMGGVTFFRRLYAQLPATRNERRLIAFTMPGQSRVYYNTANPRAIINWDQYGAAAPFTRLISASVQFNYHLWPLPQNAVPQVTKVIYSGQTGSGAEVDWQGAKYIQNGTGWIQDGATSLINGSLAAWIYSVNDRRLIGPIWETEIVTVNALVY